MSEVSGLPTLLPALLPRAGGEIPVVSPVAADGAFGLLWLVIALPLAGSAVLLLWRAPPPLSPS